MKKTFGNSRSKRNKSLPFSVKPIPVTDRPTTGVPPVINSARSGFGTTSAPSSDPVIGAPSPVIPPTQVSPLPSFSGGNSGSSYGGSGDGFRYLADRTRQFFDRLSQLISSGRFARAGTDDSEHLVQIAESPSARITSVVDVKHVTYMEGYAEAQAQSAQQAGTDAERRANDLTRNL